MWAGFMTMFPALGDADWGEASEMIPAAGENAGIMKTAISVATLGMLIMAAGRKPPPVETRLWGRHFMAPPGPSVLPVKPLVFWGWPL